MNHSTWIVFDFETTGFNGEKDQIIELGALKIKHPLTKDATFEPLQFLVMNESPLPPKIIEITNITDAMLLREGIPLVSAAQQIDAFFEEDALLIGYNIMFDIGFLVPLLKKYSRLNYQFKHDIMDVLTLYKDHYPFPHKLESAVSKLSIKMKNTHRALDDVYATYEVLKTIHELNPGIYEHYINFIGFHHEYGYRGLKLPHVTYVPQRSGQQDVLKAKKNTP